MASDDLIPETIPFGKYKGMHYLKLPIDYVEWLVSASSHYWVDDMRDKLEARFNSADHLEIEPWELMRDQREAADTIDYYLFEQGGPYIRLQGGAGYGKSFTIKEIVLRAKRRGFRVAACATSYVATQNVARDLEPLDVSCGTIARMLRLSVVYEGWREKYLVGAGTDYALTKLLARDNLLIVDEYSMVSDSIGMAMINAAVAYGGKLLVVGDSYQLPSPEQDWDSVLARLEPAVELTIPKRYTAESDLFQVERIARHTPFEFHPSRFNGSREVQSRHTRPELVEAYVDSYRRNGGHHTMIWYTRADMVQSNRDIRRALYGADCDDIREDEQLRIQRTGDYTLVYNQTEDNPRFYSGVVFKAVHVEHALRDVCMYDIDKDFVIPTYRIQDEYGNIFHALFSVDDKRIEDGTRGAEEYNAALKQIGEWCDANNAWGPYRAFKNCFVQVAYDYATTVHRIQGQTVDYAFTSPEALRRAQPFVATKLQYVGLTRARHGLTCL